MARLAARHASQDELAALHELIAENAAAVECDDRGAAQRIDVRLHAAIADASGNGVFRAVAAAMNGLFIDVRRATGGIPGASQAALDEHRRIVAAIERRDGRLAETAARAHIRGTQARYSTVRARAPRGSADHMRSQGRVVEFDP
jgi:GntR family transcriptional repressor for pyruvate dehydrogenase complex